MQVQVRKSHMRGQNCNFCILLLTSAFHVYPEM